MEKNPITSLKNDMWNCKNCDSTNVVGVEYAYGDPDRYDGISEWSCNSCGKRFGRWTGKELGEGEKEPRYGYVEGRTTI